ncbi:unnamed protein product [Meloidogyne enterolobii]|uniref:Uncharacterized protein n=1 Tax=Meloidogyne enterolobii TaxID=390850 RepID=A0ACB0ZR09_MELEN
MSKKGRVKMMRFAPFKRRLPLISLKKIFDRFFKLNVYINNRLSDSRVVTNLKARKALSKH